jgi:uncharacterized protein (DUF1810 family)
VEDVFELERFVRAQDNGGTYDQALAEVRRGRKVSHWMWFVFPQIAGLGRSAMAQRYALASLDEAKAYLAHDVLGPRLLESAAIVDSLTGVSAEDVFGGIDAMKLASSMTLFSLASPSEAIFAQVLVHYFDGRPDPATMDLVSPTGRAGTSR